MLLQKKAIAATVLGLSLFATDANIFFPRFDTVADIPKQYFSEKRTIHGRVERVIDGDTLRIRHCSTRFACPKADPNVKRIYDSTLSIRIYGVDCPELQKRKTDLPSQPFAEEAKDFASDLVLDKKVRVKLLRKDQYGRAVGKVESKGWFGRKDLSVQLIERGLASLYTGGGAEYDGNRELLEKKQKQAERKRKGIWKAGSDNRVTPAEYKRQQKLKREAVR